MTTIPAKLKRSVAVLSAGPRLLPRTPLQPPLRQNPSPGDMNFESECPDSTKAAHHGSPCAIRNRRNNALAEQLNILTN